MNKEELRLYADKLREAVGEYLNEHKNISHTEKTVINNLLISLAELQVPEMF